MDKLTKFLEAAVASANDAQRFDPNPITKRMNLTGNELTAIGAELQQQGLLTVSYAQNGVDEWQLVGQAREAAKAIQKNKPVLKPKSIRETVKPISRRSIPRKNR